MNITRVQRELFNILVSRNARPSIIKCGDAILFVPDGYRGYVIPESSLILDKEKFKKGQRRRRKADL